MFEGVQDGPAQPEPTTDPRIAEEVDQIRGWQGSGGADASGLTPHTLVSLLVAASLSAVVATLPRSESTLIVVAMLGLLGALAFFFTSAADDAYASRRCGLRSPIEAAEYLFGRLSLGRFAHAADALAAHPRGRSRQAQVLQAWSDAARDFGVRARGESIRGVAEDIAVATIQLVFRERSRLRFVSFLVGIPLALFLGDLALQVQLGKLYVPHLRLGWMIVALILGHGLYRRCTPEHGALLDKLAICREGRWYLVSGLLDDRLDRQLLAALESKAADRESPIPGDSPSAGL